MAKKVNLSAILAIIAGLVVLAAPQILAWAVGLYLIVFGILELVNK